jgi:hypothetical protein
LANLAKTDGKRDDPPHVEMHGEQIESGSIVAETVKIDGQCMPDWGWR